MHRSHKGGIFNMTEKQVSFHAASSKRKILVVEDELINREILSFMLQDAYDVLLAETGSQAKALLNDHYKTPWYEWMFRGLSFIADAGEVGYLAGLQAQVNALMASSE